ncbi:MAG: hypothetical protein V1891_03950 [bacterium]
MVIKQMSMSSRLELLKEAKKRYLKSSKKKKKKILDELCANTGYHRKYAIRRLAACISLSEPKVINKKRNCAYTRHDIFWLAKVWEILDYPCGQRLQPVLAQTIDKLVIDKKLNIPNGVSEKLKKISITTIDERLKPWREKLAAKMKRINGTTKPGSLLKKQIPIRTSSWDELRAGYCELDTVAHCGESAAGEFINSLNLTDILTQWTEGAAIMGKAEKRIKDGLDEIANRLPFPLKGIDPDNGSEFINWQLYNHCVEKQIEFTRGRPYKKNDNAHIEQKNWTHVRKVFGYERLEIDDQLNLMNGLYRNELRLYKNFFLPCIKLVDKKRVGKNQEKIKRIYDKAKTPYQRVMECGQINDDAKQKLKEQYDKINPVDLRKDILEKLKELSRLRRHKDITKN